MDFGLGGIMNANTRGSLKNSRNNNDLKTHIHTIEEEVVAARDTVLKSIGDSSEKLTLVPAMVNRLTAIGKPEKVDELFDLSKSLARDIDTYIDESSKLNTRFDQVRQRHPTKKSHLGRYNAECMTLGREYKHLGERVVNNILPSIQQILEVAELQVGETADKIVVFDKDSTK